MPRPFKLTNKGAFFACPEDTQGTAQWERKTTSASVNKDELFDSALSGANDRWKYFGVYWTSGANQGEYQEVDAFDSGTKKLSFSADFTAVPSNNDEYALLLRIPAGNISMAPEVEKVNREFETKFLDKLSHQTTFLNSPVSFDSEIPGLTIAAGDGVTPSYDWFSHLLECIGERTTVKGNKCTSGSTTTVLNVAALNGLKATDFIMINGFIRRVKETTTTTVTLERALLVAPATNDVIYGCEQYRPDEDNIPSFTLIHCNHDQAMVTTGAILNLKGTWNFGGHPMLSFEGSGNSWDLRDDFVMPGNLPSNIAKPSLQGEFGVWVPGTPNDTFVAIPVAECGFDVGHGVENVRDSEASNIPKVTDRNSTCNLKIRNKDKTIKTSWDKDALKLELIAQVGNEPGNARALVFYGQLQSVSLSDHTGHSHYDATMNLAVDSGDRITILRF